MKRLLLLLTLFLFAGCGVAQTTHTHTHKTMKPAPVWKPSKRCYTIGTAAGQHVSMAAQRNCLKNGVTSLAVMVLHPKKDTPKEIAEETLKLMVTILGFKPALALLTMGRAKGKPFYVFIVTGEARQ